MSKEIIESPSGWRYCASQENGDNVDCQGCGNPLNDDLPIVNDREGYAYHKDCLVGVDRYKVNDALSALATDTGVELSDETLNELTHHVADVLEGKPPATSGAGFAITFGDDTREKILTALALLEGCNVAVKLESGPEDVCVMRVAQADVDLWVMQLDNESEPTGPPIALSLVDVESVHVY